MGLGIRFAHAWAAAQLSIAVDPVEKVNDKGNTTINQMFAEIITNALPCQTGCVYGNTLGEHTVASVLGKPIETHEIENLPGRTITIYLLIVLDKLKKAIIDYDSKRQVCDVDDTDVYFRDWVDQLQKVSEQELIQRLTAIVS